jgi:hypothetical protein
MVLLLFQNSTQCMFCFFLRLTPVVTSVARGVQEVVLDFNYFAENRFKTKKKNVCTQGNNGAVAVPK